MTVSKIDWHAVRSRLVFAGDALGIPEAETKAITGSSDRALNLYPELTAFCRRHGLSLDWIVLGDPRPLIIDASRLRSLQDAQTEAA